VTSVKNIWIMEEQLITFETAKLAKEKGFDLETKHWYDQTGTLNPVKGPRGGMFYTNVGYAPTQSSLQKWIREKHCIHICVRPDYTNTWISYITSGYKEVTYKGDIIWCRDSWICHEDALENALQTALNLIS